MFGRLPHFFERDFAVGYFLPTLIFLVAVLSLGSVYDILPTTIALFISPTNQLNVLIDTTLMGIGAWLGGVVLLALNRDLIRFLEGYHWWNPLRLGIYFERGRYTSIRQEVQTLDTTYLQQCEQNTARSQDILRQRGKLLHYMVNAFPDEESLLPTSFGNIIRAFEVYPRRMYGIDSIPGWSRVLAVVPESYQRLIDHEKSLVDFWVNVCLLSALYGVGYLFLFGYTWLISGASVPGYLWAVVMSGAIGIVWLSYTRAKAAAREWGEVFKAAFDLYVPALRTQLMFPTPATPAAERQMWHAFSRAILYHDPDDLPARQPPTCDQEAPSNHRGVSIVEE